MNVVDAVPTAIHPVGSGTLTCIQLYPSVIAGRPGSRAASANAPRLRTPTSPAASPAKSRMTRSRSARIQMSMKYPGLGDGLGRSLGVTATTLGVGEGRDVSLADALEEVRDEVAGEAPAASGSAL